jgi:hypothetical protein
MRVLGYAAAIALLTHTAAWADSCSDFDQKVTRQFAGPIAAATTACQKTALLIKEMNVALHAPSECLNDTDRATLKAGIRQSKQSFRDQNCGN